MPQPSNSTQPLVLHTLHGSFALIYPLPPHLKQVIAISALGSVNGKNDGCSRVFVLEPKNDFMAWSSVPLRSQKVMFVSTHKPSIWWNIGECVASASSLRWTLPGMTIRTGGGCFSIVR